jgi:ribosome-associated protein
MAKKNAPESSRVLADTVIAGMQEVKGHEIICLDLRKIPHAIADFFVICHGNSHTQVDALARSIERETELKLNESPWHKEGLTNSEWVLLDYGDVVAHVFYRESRSFYGLEDLWADAGIEKIEEAAVKESNNILDVRKSRK